MTTVDEKRIETLTRQLRTLRAAAERVYQACVVDEFKLDIDQRARDLRAVLDETVEPPEACAKLAHMSLFDGTTKLLAVPAAEVGPLVAKFCRECGRVYPRSDDAQRCIDGCGGARLLDWCDAEGRFVDEAS
jgi:hypothetical protein